MKANNYIASLALLFTLTLVNASQDRAEQLKQLLVTSVKTLKQRNPEQFTPQFIALCDSLLQTNNDNRASRLAAISESEIRHAASCAPFHDLANHVHALALEDKELVFVSLVQDLVDETNKHSLREHVDRFTEFMKDSHGHTHAEYQAFCSKMQGYRNETNSFKAIPIILSLNNTPLPARARAMVMAILDKGDKGKMLKTIQYRITANK